MMGASFSNNAFNGARARKLSGRPVLLALLVTTMSLCSAALSAEEAKVIRSSDLVRSIGVITHMNYNDGAYAKLDNVLKDLKFLGISNVRDMLPGADSQPGLQARDAIRRMVHENIKFDMLVTSGWTPVSIAWLRSLESAVPGCIASIEGYNEINNFPVTFEGKTGPEAAKAGQRALYETVKSDPVLKHIPVLDMTGFEMIRDPTFSYATTLAGYADVMNLHFYAQNGAQPGAWFSPAPESFYKNAGDLPKVITEFGYSSRPESNWGFIGVDEQGQAKGILNGLFDAARSGYDKVYLYELLDEKPDPKMKELEFHFGLFSFANEPKPAARAIRNLTTILTGSRGPSPQPAAPPTSDRSIKVRLDEPEDGIPALSLVLVKDDGAPIVAVWRETSFWDRAIGHPLDAPSIRGNISFGSACESVRTYDVLQSSDPISVGKGTSLDLAINDHVQLIECTR